jgi:hypothetical protein
MKPQEQLNYDDPKVVEAIRKFKPKYEDGVQFLHCANCLDDRPEGTSPEMWAKQLAVSVPMEIKGVKTGILVIFCVRCKMQVWDTRHLKHAY